MRKLILLLMLFCLGVNYIASQTILNKKGKEELLAKSDSLFAVGVDLYNAEKYEEAIPIFAESDKIDKAVLDSTSNRRDYSAIWIASCYYQLGDTLKASETHEYYNYAPVDRRLTVRSDSLAAIGNIALVNGELENALTYFEQCAEIEKSVVGEEHVWYLNSLTAIDILYFNLAKNNYSLGNYAEAIKLGTKELDICEELYGKEHPDYALSLNNLALYNSSLGNYSEAIRLGVEAMNIRERVYGREHPDYANSLNNLAGYNSYLGNYTEAIKLGAEALNIFEKVYGTEHPDYANSLNNLALYNSYLGNYTEAIRLGTEVLNIYEKVYGKEHSYYVTSLLTLSSFNYYIENYIEAKRLSREALTIYEKTNDFYNRNNAISLSGLACYNDALGYYLEAITYSIMSLNIYEKLYGKVHPIYAQSLNNLATYYAHQGSLSEAITYCTIAMDLQEEILGKEHPEYAASLNNLAYYNNALGNYLEAIRLGTEVLNIHGKVYGKEHPDYAISLSNLASYNSSSGNYSEAIRLGTEALNISEKVFGKEHPDYATILSNLAGYNSSLGNYTEAIRLGTEALNIREKVYGRGHLDYAKLLGNLAFYYFGIGNNTQATSYILETSELKTKLLMETFSIKTLAERTSFWNKYSDWYEKDINVFTYRQPSHELSSNGNNGVLLSKGLLLNSEIEFSRYIQESGDSTAIAKYDEWISLKAYIKRLREENEGRMDSILFNNLRDTAVISMHDERATLSVKINRLSKSINDLGTGQSVNVDDLEFAAQKKEKDLIEYVNTLGGYTKNLVITWDQVQEKLTDKDIAVEFVSFPLNADSTMYIAYAIKKNWECPKMIKLFEEKELQTVRARGSVYGSDEVSRLVWKPLDEMMEGVERVYFAPSGELYNIAIESIPTHEDGGETLVGEHRDYYRLSSTRELALIKDRNNWQEAAVYGGLQYGMSVEDMIKDDAKYEKRDAATRSDSSPSYYVTREDREGRDVSASVEIKPLSYLKGTLEEAIAIKEDLERQSVSTQLFTDDVGTETSFKNLHGRKTSIIHIGTHGFFNDRKKKHEENNLQLLGIDRQAKVIEDDALTRSGLYFAGADSARINGSSAIPDGIDDGKLTALEIAQLDLRGLDLVVLSACQTGLGEITGDGVFGLQRGFKKAGAQTIVMSLWKVDDKATTEFMTTFFENMKIDRDGHPLNKHEAFKEAQSKLKQDKDKYSDPYCWAAFVMLDGED